MRITDDITDDYCVCALCALYSQLQGRSALLYVFSGLVGGQVSVLVMACLVAAVHGWFVVALLCCEPGPECIVRVKPLILAEYSPWSKMNSTHTAGFCHRTCLGVRHCLESLHHWELSACNMNAVRPPVAASIVVEEAQPKIAVNEAPLRPAAANVAQPEALHLLLCFLCGRAIVLVAGEVIIGVSGPDLSIRGGRRRGPGS